MPFLLKKKNFWMTKYVKMKKKKIRKIHQVLAHPLSEILKKFLRNSSENDPEILRLVDEVNDKCDVCKRFRKSPSRPKVG